MDTDFSSPARYNLPISSSTAPRLRSRITLRHRRLSSSRKIPSSSSTTSQADFSCPTVSEAPSPYLLSAPTPLYSLRQAAAASSTRSSCAISGQLHVSSRNSLLLSPPEIYIYCFDRFLGRLLPRRSTISAISAWTGGPPGGTPGWRAGVTPVPHHHSPGGETFLRQLLTSWQQQNFLSHLLPSPAQSVTQAPLPLPVGNVVGLLRYSVGQRTEGIPLSCAACAPICLGSISIFEPPSDQTAPSLFTFL
ncbi:hypothetical protein KSP40_PGU010765 [Platanthera guangdongensis]|uniref:Uncharacterized protein n=1 Tax=Platanthera guangdongensis TaxID=2320717 RepID=A0ABR2M5Z8_9ASPA